MTPLWHFSRVLLMMKVPYQRKLHLENILQTEIIASSAFSLHCGYQQELGIYQVENSN